jgi:hypothetical protein
MIGTDSSDYVLTILQHNYCRDCMWLKGKITEVYHASSLMRGEDSKNWRIHIISPPWDRNRRQAEFPRGFQGIDVPALKLEVNGHMVFATQNPPLIDELLVRLKTMLMNHETNAQIKDHLADIARNYKDTSNAASCSINAD